MEAPKLGRLVEGNLGRDAVHVAIVPVEAGQELWPGGHTGIGEDGLAYNALMRNVKAVGIVDPFLATSVDKGQRFYLCLFPGTITSLRHVWSHPAFDAAARKRMEDMLTRELS